MRAPHPAFLLAVLAGGASAAVLALPGATSLVLRSDWLLARINARPESLFVAYTEPRASLVPGRIRFATLTLRSRDSNVEWAARLEDVCVDVRLGDLAGRRFRAKAVRAASLGFRLRERLAPRDATPERAARYPGIEGFRDPPLRGLPPPRAAAGDPWRVAVDDLRIARVREIWIDAWRWEGAGRVAGGLRLRSGIEAKVLPSELSLEHGTLRWGAEVVSRETAGHVRASLPRFQIPAYPGNEVWKIVSGSAALGGTLDGVPFLAPDGGGPRLATGTSGSARVRVALSDGRGTARLDADGTVVAKVGARALRGRVRAGVVASRIDFPAGVVAFDGTRVRLTGASFEGSSAAPWEGAAEAREARLRLTGGEFQARLAARLRDARPLVSFVPAGPPRWIAGLLDLRDFEASARVRIAPGLVAVSPARAEAGSFSLEADWRRAKGRGWGALLVRKRALSVGFGLGGAAPSVRLAGAARWFEAEGGPGGLRTGQPRVAGGRISW